MLVGCIYGSEYQLEACMAVNDSSWHVWQRMTVDGMYGSEYQLEACMAVNDSWWYVWQ